MTLYGPYEVEHRTCNNQCRARAVQRSRHENERRPPERNHVTDTASNTQPSSDQGGCDVSIAIGDLTSKNLNQDIDTEIRTDYPAYLLRRPTLLHKKFWQEQEHPYCKAD